MLAYVILLLPLVGAMMTRAGPPGDHSPTTLLPLVGAMMTRSRLQCPRLRLPVAAPRRGDDDLAGWICCAPSGCPLLPLVGAMMTGGGWGAKDKTPRLLPLVGAMMTRHVD